MQKKDNPKKKRTYHAPTVDQYGTLSGLTAGGSVTGTEGQLLFTPETTIDPRMG